VVFVRKVEVESKLKSKRVRWEVTEEARKHLAKVGYDPAYDARPLARIIQEKVKVPFVNELLFGRLSKGGYVRVDYRNGKLCFDYNNADLLTLSSTTEMKISFILIERLFNLI
jgi:ATP-dependent Clp protease ATP-binding subunit ClpA